MIATATKAGARAILVPHTFPAGQKYLWRTREPSLPVVQVYEDVAIYIRSLVAIKRKVKMELRLYGGSKRE